MVSSYYNRSEFLLQKREFVLKTHHIHETIVLIMIQPCILNATIMPTVLENLQFLDDILKGKKKKPDLPEGFEELFSNFDKDGTDIKKPR